MAVAQAQHRVHEIYDQLTKRGVDVKFAIHPVAGRMPGHMNVLLAEAEIPYEALVEMDEINPDMPQTDVALVVGANDVVNPAARHDTKSPIYGMPIIDADRAKFVIAIKRSMNPGFAGIENELYYADNTLMVFGDAKGGARRRRQGARRRRHSLVCRRLARLEKDSMQALIDLFLHFDVHLAEFVARYGARLRPAVRDRLRGNRSGRHAVSAGRFAAVCRRGARGDRRARRPADLAAPGRRGDPRQHRQLQHRPLRRAAGLPAPTRQPASCTGC